MVTRVCCRCETVFDDSHVTACPGCETDDLREYDPFDARIEDWGAIKLHVTTDDFTVTATPESMGATETSHVAIEVDGVVLAEYTKSDL